MQIGYGRGAYKRSRGNLPALILRNLFVESAPTNGDVVLQSRRGIAVDAVVGSGPVRGVYQADGVFGGDRFTVSGAGLYRGSTLIGMINGTGPVSFAGRSGELLVTAGATLFSYNGTNLTSAGFPDGANVVAVAYASGWFIALRAGTGRWYFSAVDNGRSWDGLDFANAISSPDPSLDMVLLDGAIVFFGSQSVEFWALNGAAELPFVQVQQRIFEDGIIATGCAVAIDNSFFWLAPDGIVYRNGDVPKAISHDGIVEDTLRSSRWRLFVITDERHKFVVLRLDAKTYAFDVTTGEWCEWASYGRSNFRVGPGMGDDETGTIWKWSGYADAGGQIERTFTAGAPLDGPVTINNLRLTCEVGTTKYLTGDYVEPVIEMRDSRDGGNEWSDWDQVSLGEQGRYRQRVEWRALGMFDDPGALFQFRMTAPVSFRLSDVQVQAPGGGRSR